MNVRMCMKTCVNIASSMFTVFVFLSCMKLTTGIQSISNALCVLYMSVFRATEYAVIQILCLKLFVCFKVSRVTFGVSELFETFLCVFT